MGNDRKCVCTPPLHVINYAHTFESRDAFWPIGSAHERGSGDFKRQVEKSQNIEVEDQEEEGGGLDTQKVISLPSSTKLEKKNTCIA